MQRMGKVLITGGAGYIGSTVASAFEDRGYTPVILDSLITGKKEFTVGRIFYQGDITDPQLIRKISKDHPEIDLVIHCAALIVLPDSVSNPYEYYRENVSKSIELFHHLNSCGIKKVVFSSSASIYATTSDFCVNEGSSLNPMSPYARTKYMMEMVLKDFCTAYSMSGIALRYFNPIGADPKMRSGGHAQFPTHVVAKLLQVSEGLLDSFQITGTDYPTRDGSGLRDYIHVWDLAQAHVQAAERFTQVFDPSATQHSASNYAVINLGTEKGVTVKEIHAAFEKVIGKKIPVVNAPARLGDVAGAYASATLAHRLLGWKAELSLEDGISDALKWNRLRLERLGYP
jgi:UDP-glucose 4-epimerase